MVNVNDEWLIFYIFRLQTMIQSTCKTPGFFSSKRVGTLFVYYLYIGMLMANIGIFASVNRWIN